MSQLFVAQKDKLLLKSKLKVDDEKWESIRVYLKDLADESLNHGPYSVTFSEGKAASKDPHDYYSEGPYWWPNPKDPQGPYIQRDGEFNPDIFTDHKIDFRKLCMNTLILSLGSYYLENEAYGDYAISLVKTWFVDEETRMNPHLEYGQAIHGICEGRGIGIIDTIYLINLIEGLTYIDENPKYAEIISETKKWFKAYLSWLTTSKKGIDEKTHGNNHSTWWTAQVMALAIYVGDDTVLHEAIVWYKKAIVPKQMTQDGLFPDELSRARSYHYYMFNLNAYTLIAEMAINTGEDLWHWETPDGLGLRKAVGFILTYLNKPERWTFEDVDVVKKEDNLTLQMASCRLAINGILEVNRKVGKLEYDMDTAYTNMLYPLVMFPGHCIHEDSYKLERNRRLVRYY